MNIDSIVLGNITEKNNIKNDTMYHFFYYICIIKLKHKLKNMKKLLLVALVALGTSLVSCKKSISLCEQRYDERTQLEQELENVKLQRKRVEESNSDNSFSQLQLEIAFEELEKIILKQRDLERNIMRINVALIANDCK